MNLPINKTQPISQCCHKNEIQCSCCSPLWKYLLPNVGLGDIQLAKTHDEGSITKKQHEPFIFRTEESVSKSKRQHTTLGYIQTLANGQDMMVEAVGIKNGKIVVTGSYEQVKSSMPESTDEKIIHSGQTLLPGLIEPHLHILPTAAYNLMLDVGPFDGQDLLTNIMPNTPYTLNYIIDRLQSEANSEGKESSKWIMARNVDPSLLVSIDKTFNADTLDKASRKQPIFVMNASMHLAYINHAGIDAVKAKGVKINDIDNGILKELAQIVPVLEVIAHEMYPSQSDKEALSNKLDIEVQKIFSQASERGVTYMLDAGVLPADASKEKALPTGTVQTPYGYPDPISNQPAYLAWCASKPDCPVRISGSLAAPSLGEFNRNIVGKYAPNVGNSEFNISFIKLIADGSNQGLTGYQYTPYECDENFNRYSETQKSGQGICGDKQEAQKLSDQTNEGIFNYGYPLEFNALMSQAVDHGWPVMVHSNGDHSMDRTISAFSQTGLSKSTTYSRRNRIEHASLLSDDNLSQMEELGISPSFLIGHVGYWGWVFQQTIFGVEKTNLLDRCHSAINDYGMRISLHSDNSVTPLGPLRFMEQAITRLMEGAPASLPPQVLNKAECITRFQALKSVTFDAAWQCHADKWVGSLEAGKCADFVLLAQNPLTYTCDQDAYSAKGMRNIPVLETWKGGIKRYSTMDEVEALIQQNPSLKVALKQPESA